MICMLSRHFYTHQTLGVGVGGPSALLEDYARFECVPLAWCSEAAILLACGPLANMRVGNSSLDSLAQWQAERSLTVGNCKCVFVLHPFATRRAFNNRGERT